MIQDKETGYSLKSSMLAEKTWESAIKKKPRHQFCGSGSETKGHVKNRNTIKTKSSSTFYMDLVQNVSHSTTV
jgi:hypothetical protein